MLQSTSFGTWIETGVDSKDGRGSQRHYRKQRREVREEMTLTVEYFEMTSKNVEHFKITATASSHWVTYVRTEEEYKQKKKLATRPHADSHTYRLTRFLTNTHITVCTHTPLLFWHVWLEKNPLVHALRYLKKKEKPKVKQVSTEKAWEKFQWSRKSRTVKTTAASISRGVWLPSRWVRVRVRVRCVWVCVCVCVCYFTFALGQELFYTTTTQDFSQQCHSFCHSFF